MSARSVIAEALGWEYVRTRDVGDMAPAHHDDYRTPDGRVFNTEPPYWQNAIAAEIDALRARVVAAEEDADRLHEIAGNLLISVQRGWGITMGQRAKLEAAVDAHRAVSSRPKATQSAPNGEPT